MHGPVGYAVMGANFGGCYGMGRAIKTPCEASERFGFSGVVEHGRLRGGRAGFGCVAGRLANGLAYSTVFGRAGRCKGCCVVGVARYLVSRAGMQIAVQQVS